MNYEKVTIYLVSIMLMEDELDLDVLPIKCYNKPKMYSCISKKSVSIFIASQSISKDKIMKIDSAWMNNHKVIGFHTFCLESDIEAAKQMVLDATNKKLAEISSNIQKMNEQLNKQRNEKR